MSSSLPSLRNILFICILQLMEFWFNVVGIILEDSASLICRDDKYYIETKAKVGLLLFGCEIIISCPFTISEVSCGVQWKPRRTLLHDIFPDVYKASYACCQSPSRCQSNQLPVASTECLVKLMNGNLKKTFENFPKPQLKISTLLLLPPP